MKTRLLRKCRKGIRIIEWRRFLYMEKYNKENGHWEYYRSSATIDRLLTEMHHAMVCSKSYKQAQAMKKIDDYYKKEKQKKLIC